MGSRPDVAVTLASVALAIAVAPSLSGCRKKPRPETTLLGLTHLFSAKSPATRPSAVAPPLQLPNPAPGHAHVKGRVTFGGEPVAGTDVELCTSGCAQVYRATTDANGDYAFRDVAAGTYGYLGVRLFDSDSFQSLWQRGSKREIPSGAAFIENASLVRSDLALVYPRAAARVVAAPTFKWSPYPNAVEYVLTIERAPGESPFTTVVREKHVKGTSFSLGAPLAPGRWQIGMSAYNESSIRIADLPARVVFIVSAPDDPTPPSTEEGPSVLPRSKRLPTIEPARAEPGFGGVQGLVALGDEPAAGVEVKLCEGYTELAGCSGKSLTAKTDERGMYLFTKVPPHKYRGLAVRVFETHDVAFAGLGSGTGRPTSFKVLADQLVLPRTVYLVRGDLHVTAPPPVVESGRPELAWKPYPKAAYYSVRLVRNAATTPEFPYLDFRVDEPRFVVDRALASGTYALTVAAHDLAGRRLADNDKRPRTFTVTVK